MRFWVGRDYDGPGPTVCPQATAIQCHAKRGLPSGAKCVATTTHWVAGPPNKRSCRDGGFVAAHPGAVNARVTPFTKHTIIKARPAPRKARPRPPASVFKPHTRSPFFRPPSAHSDPHWPLLPARSLPPWGPVRNTPHPWSGAGGFYCAPQCFVAMASPRSRSIRRRRTSNNFSSNAGSARA